MGEVYRARDTRLGRDVALKVLPSHLAADPTALARFEREARSVAALNHPHILAIFDFGREGAVTYAATELLEGKTLREQLASEHPPLRRGLEIARQIASGLAAAHDKGIVHRDLKPENTFVTRDGSVKILDFGLARPVTQAGHDAATMAATADVRTDAGTVLGTVGYMAPEQVRGREVDHRADIFAFGAVLYEIIGGMRPFRAETSAEVLTAILREDPPELTRTVAGLTPAIDRLVRRCLEKDPEHRFQSARDLGFALDAIGSTADSSSVAAPTAAAPPQRGRQVSIAVAAVTALTAFTAGASLMRVAGSPTAPTVVRPQAAFTDEVRYLFSPLVAVSPDGRSVAYTAPAPDASDVAGIRTWIRRLDRTEATPLPFPSDTPRVWSADGRSLLVTNGSAFARIDVATSQRTVLGEAPELHRGVAWLPDGSVLAGFERGIVRLRFGTGEPTDVVARVADRETWLGWPTLLPDSRRFLYLARPAGTAEGAEVRLASVDGPNTEVQTVGLQGVTGAVVVPPSGIAYIKSRTLYVQAFDLSRGTVTGNPAVVAREVFENAMSGLGAVSASPTSVIAYRSEIFPQQAFMWLDRAGRAIAEFPKRDSFTNFDLSPDGTQVAVTVRRPGAALNELWLLDLDRGLATDISEKGRAHSDATWSPDGRRLAFRLGNRVVSRAVNGGPLTTILDRLAYPETWSPDGRYIVAGAPAQLTDQYELWAIDVSGGGKPQVLITGTSGLDEPRFSPDGRWLAFNNLESGRRTQIYLTPFPPTGERFQLSVGGGTQPRWRADGRELFFLGTDGAVMSVSLPDGDVRRAGPPTQLFQTVVETSASFDQLAVSRDGQRFLVRRPPGGGGDRSPLHVLVNFDLAAALASGGERTTP
jgi:hypothetical protein